MSGTINIELSRDKLAEMVHAYETIGRFLSLVLEKGDVYKPDFSKGLDQSLLEAKQGKTDIVETFKDLSNLESVTCGENNVSNSSIS